jgi:hypothetical protein
MPLYRPRWYSEPVVPGDITVIMLTLNKPPKHWQSFYKKTLLEAIGDIPLVIVSKEPMDWNRPNTKYALQDEPPVDQVSRIHNIYTQLFKAINMAETTYIATVDDDCLYPAEHFNFYRPPLDKFSYNYCRWSINSWDTASPYFYHSPHPDNPMFIAPRKKLIDVMEPIPYYDGKATHFMLDCVSFYTLEPIVCFHHTNGLVGERIKRWKRPWPVRALSLPKWGEAKEIIKEWREED